MKDGNITPEVLEEILAKRDWKFFENFVETLLKIHGFKTKKHVRVKIEGILSIIQRRNSINLLKYRREI